MSDAKRHQRADELPSVWYPEDYYETELETQVKQLKELLRRERIRALRLEQSLREKDEMIARLSRSKSA